ncbi:MAG: type II toxin-antitoxin system RelE/ParE family toxin [Sphingomonadaceae bacterium]
MIRSFRSRALKRYAEKGDRSKLSLSNLRRINAILVALDEARRPEDMNVSGWRFHPLKGKMGGRYAVAASGNWRITFGWDGQHAIEVDLEDYH